MTTSITRKSAAKALAEELNAAVADIAEALHYPVDHAGRTYDVGFLKPVIAFHLARCGFRRQEERVMIKARRLPPTPGVVADAVEWVHPNAPDSIDDELAGKTIEDIDRLSPAARAELIRRLGGNPQATAEQTPLEDRTPWHVETRVHFDDNNQENRQ
jgi:hypothetical protein